MSSPAGSAPDTDYFNQDMAEKYDARNSKLAIISNNVHFLADMILAPLPARARILCVGAGTGAEIFALAQRHPHWRFVAVDPSQSMLDVCRRKLAQADLLDRCELVHGHVQDVPDAPPFDSVMSMLVAHFIPVDERRSYYREIYNRLKPGGYFISAEISHDLDAEDFPAMLENWKQVQALMGASPESLAGLRDVLRNTLSVASPEQTESMLRDAGYRLPVQFLQSFMIRGWYGVK